MCDTNGGSMPEEVAALAKEAAAAVRRPARHPHAQRLRPGRGQLAGRGRGRARRRCRARSTASASAAATSTSSRVDRQPRAQEDGLRGARRPGSLAHLTELSRYVYEIANMNFRIEPAVRRAQRVRPQGRHARARRRRARPSYEHIDPETVGNERRVLVSELSGRSNILALTTKRQPAARHGADERDPARRCVDLENRGYQFEAAEASFDLLVQRVAGHCSGRISSCCTTTSTSRPTATARRRPRPR